MPVVVVRRFVARVLVVVVVVMDDGGGGGGGDGSVMTVRHAELLDDRPETVHVVGRVLDHARRAVRLEQTVRPLDRAPAVAHLVLALHVARVRVLDVVTEVVRRGVVVVVVVVVPVTVVVTAVVTAGRRPPVTGLRVSQRRAQQNDGGGGDERQLKSSNESVRCWGTHVKATHPRFDLSFDEIDRPRSGKNTLPSRRQKKLSLEL